MNKRALLLGGLIVLAALVRFLPHPPNFAPLAALAVFAAIRYRSRWAGLIVPLLAYVLSDLLIQIQFRNGFSSQWGIYKGMWVNYAIIVVVALASRLVHGTRSPLTIGAATLTGSCIFFLASNFAVWAGGARYPHTGAGLASCYVAAIPFFRNTLFADVTYAGALFGVWALAEAYYPVLRQAPAPVPASPDLVRET